jgi:hypothetical protein
VPYSNVSASPSGSDQPAAEARKAPLGKTAAFWSSVMQLPAQAGALLRATVSEAVPTALSCVMLTLTVMRPPEGRPAGRMVAETLARPWVLVELRVMEEPAG